MLADGATEYEFRDGTVQELTGGNFLIIPPGVEHRGLYNLRRPARLCGILFDLSRADSIQGTPFVASDLTWIADQVNSGACMSHRMSFDMKGYFKLLLADLKKLDSADRSMIISFRSLICAILHHAAKRIISERTLKPSRVVESAIIYMKANLHADASIEALTKSVRCSRARLFKLFKETIGMTPNDYWQRLRVDLSMELLKDPDKSITDVAFESGFASSQYFSTVFRKYSGRSPSEYRTAGNSEKG
jgi:AraC-like DNA-binding protein